MFLITTSFLQLRKQTLKSNFHQNIIQTTYFQIYQIFLTPTDKNEISFIISSLDSHKSSGPNSPNSIPVKTLKLLNYEISQQLSEIFNMSFANGQFPTVVKIAIVIPIHKNQSKVNYTNYRPISFLSNIETIIEKPMYKRLSNFLDIYNLIYLLQFGFRLKHSLPML